MIDDPRHDDLERLVRAFEVDLGEQVDPGVGGPTAEEMAADKAAIVERFRAATARPAVAVPPRGAGVRDLCVDLVRSPALHVLVLLLVLLVVLPHHAVVLVLLFVVAPITLVAKWSSEAYRGAELDRHGASLGERSVQFRNARRRLDDVLEVLDQDARRRSGRRGPPDRRTAAFRSSVVAARDGLADMATRLSTGSRSAQAAVARWAADPDASRSADQGELARLEPGAVGDALTELVARLHRLAPMAVDLDLAAEGTDRSAAGGLAGRLTGIDREVDRARGPIVRECRRLWRSFDVEHRHAAVRVLRTRTPRVAARIAALVVLVAPGLSTWSPTVRTRRRAAYLSAVSAPRELSPGRALRAVAAMRRAG